MQICSGKNSVPKLFKKLIWGSLGLHLGGGFGSSWASFGRSWGLFGRSWGALARSWGQDELQEAFWMDCGSLWEGLGVVWEGFGTNLKGFGTACWALLGFVGLC